MPINNISSKTSSAPKKIVAKTSMISSLDQSKKLDKLEVYKDEKTESNFAPSKINYTKLIKPKSIKDIKTLIEPGSHKDVKKSQIESDVEYNELTSSNESLYSDSTESDFSNDSPIMRSAELIDTDEEKECQHLNTDNRSNIETCEDCGRELYQELSLEQEWRYYGDRDTKNSADPSRCQRRRTPEKGIQKELERLGFPTDIASEANRLYMKVTNGEVKKNNLRKGLMFACLFEAYKSFNRHQVPEELRKRLDINRRCMSKGITYYRLKCDRNEISTDTITSRHYIPGIMKIFNIKQIHIDNVVELCNTIENLHSSILNRSTPENISISIVYYYLRHVGADINIENYSTIVSVSVNILQRLSTEIERLLE